MNVVIKNFVFIESADLVLSEGFTLVKGRNQDSLSNHSNGSGKTLLLEAILWCLWGDSIRGTSVSDLVGPFDDSMSVSVEFSTANGLIRVVRGRKNNKSSLSVFVDGNEESFHKISQTQERINELIEVDSYNRVYFGEYSKHILDMTPSERRDEIIRLIGYNDAAHEEMKLAIKASIRSEEDNIVSLKAKISVLQESLDKIEGESLGKIDSVKAEIEKLNSKLASLKTELNKSFEKECPFSEVDVPTIDEDQFLTEVQDAQRLKEEVGDDLHRAKSELSTTQNTLNEVRSKYQSFFDANAATYRQKQLELISSYQDFDRTFKDSLKESELKVDRAKSEHKKVCLDLSGCEHLIGELTYSLERVSGACELNECSACKQKLATDESRKAIEEQKNSIQDKLDAAKYTQKDLIEKEKDLRLTVSTLQSQFEELKEKFDHESEQKKEALRKELTGNAIEYGEIFSEFLGFEITLVLSQWSKGNIDSSLNDVREQFELKMSEDTSKYREVVSEQEQHIQTLSQLYSDRERAIKSLAERHRKERDGVAKAIQNNQNRVRWLDEYAAFNEMKINEISSVKAHISSKTVEMESLQSSIEETIKTKRAEIDREISKYDKGILSSEANINSLGIVNAKLSTYKAHIVSQFLTLFESKINEFLSGIESDIVMRIDSTESSLEFLFSDASKTTFVPYKAASRGERTRLKKVFFQALIDVFAPPFVLSDESYDGLDESGIDFISRFTIQNNSNRIYLEASPSFLQATEEMAPSRITCEKSGGVIRITQV